MEKSKSLYELARIVAPFALAVKKEMERLEVKEHNNPVSAIACGQGLARANERTELFLQDMEKEFPAFAALIQRVANQLTNIDGRVFDRSPELKNYRREG